MAIVRTILAGAAAVTIANTAASAQVTQAGRITKLDPAGMITLEHPRNGQAGEPTVTDSFKVKGGLAVKALKTGDKVVFTAAQVGGVWTVTKIQKQ